MKIPEHRFAAIKDHMVEQRFNGNEFVAFLSGDLVQDKAQLFCFADQYSAAEFCYEHTTDYDRYDYLATRSVYRAMSWAEKDKQQFRGKDGLLDLEDMVMAYHRSLETDTIEQFKNNTIMNEKNFEYLKDQVKFTGFGDSLEAPLKDKLQQAGDFTLQHKHEFGKDEAEATLYFRKSNKEDMHFFNRYDVALKQYPSDEIMKQTFQIGKENNYTFKEAVNLMSGRAVHKELDKLQKVEGETNRYESTGEKYRAWVKLDFKETDNYGNFKKKYFNENYGFDLEKALEKHPIKELSDSESRKNLIESLEKGNRQQVTFVKDGSEQKHFVEANPSSRGLNVYDGSMVRVDQRSTQREQQTPGDTKQSAKQSKENTAGADDDGAPKGKAKRKSTRQKMS